LRDPIYQNIACKALGDFIAHTLHELVVIWQIMQLIDPLLNDREMSSHLAQFLFEDFELPSARGLRIVADQHFPGVHSIGADRADSPEIKPNAF